MGLDLGNYSVFSHDQIDDDVSVANLITRLGELTAGTIDFGSSSSTHLNVLGNITVGGTVDGVDIAALNTTVAGLGAPSWSSITSKPTTLAGFGITDIKPSATSTASGGVKILSTAANAAMQVPTTTAGRNYSIQHMTSAQAMVNVPWTDTTYSLATASVSGLCQVYNSIEADSTVCEEEVEGRRYKIQHDADTDLSVCVPWTDTVYTLPEATSTVRGGIELFSDTDNPTIANAVTSTSSRTYGLQLNAAGQGVINVPWTDTTYSEATSSAEGLMSTAHHDKLDGIEANADVTDATNVEAAGALMDSELTDLAGVKGMTVANKADLASPTFTGTPAAPTAGDGTNTTQIATTAFVKQELDARYSYQYINLSFKISAVSNENWYFPGQDGVNYYLWGNNVAGSADPTDVAVGTTITVDRYDYQSGIVIPKACELVSFHGQIRHHAYSPNTIKPVFALFKAAMPSDGTTSDLTPSCIAFNDDSLIGSGNRLNRINKIESTHTASLSAYDIIYPAYGANANPTSNGTVRGMITIVLKTLIP